MEKDIESFILSSTCATVACLNEEGSPYCFSCFYTYQKEHQLLHFKSSLDTHHAQYLLKNEKVAGTILPDKLLKTAVKGIQFTGRLLNNDDPLTLQAAKAYHLQHPYALAVPGQIWTIQIDQFKLTDSTLVFKKKLLWSRP